METTPATRKVSEFHVHANEWQDEACENMESLCIRASAAALFNTSPTDREIATENNIFFSPLPPPYFLKAEFNWFYAFSFHQEVIKQCFPI